MNKTSLLATAFLIGGFATQHLRAETLASYDFSTNLAPTSSVAGLTAGTVVLGSFNGVSAAFNYGRSSATGGNLFVRAEDTAGGAPNYILQTTEAQALSTNSYFEFTFTPTEGEAFDFTSFAVDIGSQTISAGSGDTTVKDAYTGYFFVRSSVDSFASNLASASFFTTSKISGVHGPNQTLTSILGSDFTNISSAVTFRIYLHIETENRVDLQSLRLDNVVLSGNVAIPEPANAGALLGMAMVLTVFATRRRARR
jgi:hypothetical protein